LACSQLFFKCHNEPLSILNIIVKFIYKTIYKIHFMVSSQCGGEWKLGLKIALDMLSLWLLASLLALMERPQKKRKGKESKSSLLKFWINPICEHQNPNLTTRIFNLEPCDFFYN
jgi:hypothetical protein